MALWGNRSGKPQDAPGQPPTTPPTPLERECQRIADERRHREFARWLVEHGRIGDDDTEAAE